MGRVADILAKKGSQVYTIERTQSVLEAVKKMVELNTGSLLVTQAGEVCGIVSERDYLRDIVLEGRTSKTTQVREIMTPNVICVGANHSIEQCMAIMTEKRIRHLPVVDKGKLAGVVSIGDLVKQLSRDQQYEIKYLTDYITGKYPG